MPIAARVSLQGEMCRPALCACRIVKEAGVTLVAFGFATAGTVLGTLVAWGFLGRHLGQDGWKVVRVPFVSIPVTAVPLLVPPAVSSCRFLMSNLHCAGCEREIRSRIVHAGIIWECLRGSMTAW